MPDDIITRDSEGQLAVNTVSSTEANVPYNYDDCFTIDTNGRRALRVVGGNGGSVDTSKIVNADVLPIASADNLGYFYLYTGATDANYTHGYIYECVGAGEPVVYSWEQSNTQPVPTASEIGAVTKSTASIALISTDWSSHSQTITVTGVTADNTVIVSPASASASDYADAEILCTAQGANSLTFTCTTDPINNISVNIVILN